MTATHISADKFDDARASEYEEQSRIALAGYAACHELTACILSASIEKGWNARLLVVGAGGTGQDIKLMGQLEPGWQFVAVDPSAPMLTLAQTAARATPVWERITWHEGFVDSLPNQAEFDAATLIGVLHHTPGRHAKLALLRSIASRLRPGAPFVLACNRGAYQQNTLFLGAWANRWRQAGTSETDVDTKVGRILQSADPPASDAEVGQLLSSSGFGAPELFFSSLFWGGWISKRC